MMQANRDYGVRVIRAFDFWSVGDIFFPTGLHRSHLIDCGYVEPVKPPAEHTKADKRREAKPK